MTNTPLETVDYVSRVNLKPLRFKLISLPGKVLLITTGIVGILVSIPLFCSIVGIPIGFFSFVGGVGFLHAAKGYQKVTCPRCNHKRNYVANRSLNFKCVKCKQLTVVDWEE